MGQLGMQVIDGSFSHSSLRRSLSRIAICTGLHMVKGIGSLGQSGGVRRTSKNYECGGKREVRHNGSGTEANTLAKAPERAWANLVSTDLPKQVYPGGCMG